MPYSPGDLLLNKYRIESLIGQGAFAEVYHATHLALNAPRALKILRRDAPGVGTTEYTDFHARFQLEAQLGAKLDHPNIIQVYDFEQDRKTLILVMEYAEGGNLASRIQRAREKDQLIPLEEAIRKMTALPAGKMGIANRGLLKESFFADINIFDPATIIDKATFDKPHQYPEGIKYVIVNGEVVVDNGKHTGARPGMVLKKK